MLTGNEKIFSKEMLQEKREKQEKRKEAQGQKSKSTANW